MREYVLGSARSVAQPIERLRAGSLVTLGAHLRHPLAL
jgi:hypothetical protein